MPLFIIWFGIAETSKIGLIALGSFFPVYLNLFSGIRNVDSRLVGGLPGLRPEPPGPRVAGDDPGGAPPAARRARQSIGVACCRWWWSSRPTPGPGSVP